MNSLGMEAAASWVQDPAVGIGSSRVWDPAVFGIQLCLGSSCARPQLCTPPAAQAPAARSSTCAWPRPCGTSAGAPLQLLGACSSSSCADPTVHIPAIRPHRGCPRCMCGGWGSADGAVQLCTAVRAGRGWLRGCSGLSPGCHGCCVGAGAGCGSPGGGSAHAWHKFGAAARRGPRLCPAGPRWDAGGAAWGAPKPWHVAPRGAARAFRLQQWGGGSWGHRGFVSCCPCCAPPCWHIPAAVYAWADGNSPGVKGARGRQPWCAWGAPCCAHGSCSCVQGMSSGWSQGSAPHQHHHRPLKWGQAVAGGSSTARHTLPEDGLHLVPRAPQPAGHGTSPDAATDRFWDGKLTNTGGFLVKSALGRQVGTSCVGQGGAGISAGAKTASEGPGTGTCVGDSRARTPSGRGALGDRLLGHCGRSAVLSPVPAPPPWHRGSLPLGLVPAPRAR